MLRHHHPDAFPAALLSSQPLGTYAPAQLLRVAKEHRFVVLPVDGSVNEWARAMEEVQKAALAR